MMIVGVKNKYKGKYNMSLIINNTCISCGKCEKTCSDDAISIGDDQYFIAQNKCTECNMCLGHCPVEAIVKT